MRFGLSEEVIQKIKEAFVKRGIKKIFVFGSRAKGNYKPYSDIDLAVEEIDFTTKVAILNELDDLPYFIDIVNMKRASKDFRAY
jgi:predicted nucleotidyltransferase